MFEIQERQEESMFFYSERKKGNDCAGITSSGVSSGVSSSHYPSSYSSSVSPSSSASFFSSASVFSSASSSSGGGIPSGWVEWYRGVDAGKLSQLIEVTRKAAADRFFEILERNSSGTIPDASAVQTAVSVLRTFLKEQVMNALWLETLAGEKLPEEKIIFLRDHLMQLEPLLEITNPVSLEVECRPLPLCVSAGLGAFFGLYLGALLVRIIAVPAEAGMLVGAPLGAFLTLGAAFLVVNHPKVRKTVFLALGAAALADTGIQAAKEMLPFSLPIPVPGRNSGRGAFFLRMIQYAAAAVFLLFLKKRVTYDRGSYRTLVENDVQNWLRAVSAILRILMRKEKDEKVIHVQKEDILGLVACVKKLQAASSEEKAYAAAELVQNCENLGYEMNPAEDEEQKLRWDEKTAEKYDAVDFVKNGDSVKIIREVIMNQGVVLQKGTVRKDRSCGRG